MPMPSALRRPLSGSSMQSQPSWLAPVAQQPPFSAHRAKQHASDEEEPGCDLPLLLSLLDDKWFGRSTPPLGAVGENHRSTATSGASRGSSAHQRSAVVPTPSTAAAAAAAQRESGLLFSEEELTSRRLLLSHCGSIFLSDAEPACYLTEEAARELWQQDQLLATGGGGNGRYALGTSRAAAAGTVPPLQQPGAAAHAVPPHLRRLHQHRQHSPATLSPEERTPSHDGAGGAGHVPHATSISMPCDLPAVLLPPLDSSSPMQQVHGGDTSDSLPASSTSPALAVLQVMPDFSHSHHHHLPALPLLPPPAPLVPPPPSPEQLAVATQPLHHPYAGAHHHAAPVHVLLPPSPHSPGGHDGVAHATQHPTAPLPMAQPSSTPDALPCLGTWAHRQYRMLGGAAEPPAPHVTALLEPQGSGSAGGGGHAHSQPGSIANSVPVPAPPAQGQGPPLPGAKSLSRMRTVHSDTQLLGSSADVPGGGSLTNTTTTATATPIHTWRAGDAPPPPPRTLPPPPSALGGEAGEAAFALLPGQEQPQQPPAGLPQGGQGEGALALALAPLQQQQPGQHEARPNGASDCGSDAAVEAAWRWRFARRWHAEQQRSTLPPDPGASSPDKTEEALAYLQAGGGAGWNMQVARTQSTERSGLMHSVGTHGLGSLLAGDMLLDECNSFTGNSTHHHNGAAALARTAVQQGPAKPAAAAQQPASAARQPAPSVQQQQQPVQVHGHHRSAGAALAMARDDSATRAVNSLNRRAMQLLEQQQQLERAAEEMWNASVCAGDNWLGQHVPAVEIDEWGTFKFLVVRLRGRNGRQRILVRGRNYCSEGQLVEDVNRKMAQVASQHACAPEAFEVMGGGVMEWRRERDRHLHLHSGFSAVPAAGLVGKPATCQELLNLAAVLTKQHLPVNFKVSIQGLC